MNYNIDEFNIDEIYDVEIKEEDHAGENIGEGRIIDVFKLSSKERKKAGFHPRAILNLFNSITKNNFEHKIRLAKGVIPKYILSCIIHANIDERYYSAPYYCEIHEKIADEFGISVGNIYDAVADSYVSFYDGITIIDKHKKKHRGCWVILSDKTNIEKYRNVIHQDCIKELSEEEKYRREYVRKHIKQFLSENIKRIEF